MDSTYNDVLVPAMGELLIGLGEFTTWLQKWMDWMLLHRDKKHAKITIATKTFVVELQ